MYVLFHCAGGFFESITMKKYISQSPTTNTCQASFLQVIKFATYMMEVTTEQFQAEMSLKPLTEATAVLPT